jgi:hypothetical protein
LQIAVSITETVTPILQNLKQQAAAAGNVHLHVGATAGYAFFVEFGTRRMAAEPFIRPAVDAYFSQLVDGIKNGFFTEDVLAAFEEGGSNMETMAQSICPVRTGFLRSTIYHTVG